MFSFSDLFSGRACHALIINAVFFWLAVGSSFRSDFGHCVGVQS